MRRSSSAAPAVLPLRERPLNPSRLRRAATLVVVVVVTACGPPAPEPYIRIAADVPAGLVSGAQRARLVTFWATWCPYCVEETAALLRLAKTQPDGFDVVVVSEDKTFADVNAFFGGAVPSELHLVLDEDWNLAHRLRVHELPTSIFVVDGVAVARFDGARRWDGPSAGQTLHRLLLASRRSGP